MKTLRALAVALAAAFLGLCWMLFRRKPRSIQTTVLDGVHLAEAEARLQEEAEALNLMTQKEKALYVERKLERFSKRSD